MKSLRKESGSALVITIVVLFVLTALGLALSLVAATENSISVNYQWGEMAFYNADAGLEYAKNVLAVYARDSGGRQFQDALPPPRDAAQMNALPAGNPQGRDYQFAFQESTNVTTYIGKVLVDPRNGRRLEFDFRSPGAGNGLKGGDVDGDDKPDVQGTVTLWVRRPIVNGRDYAGNERVVVTAEGTAPNYEGFAGRFSAVRRLEMTLSLNANGSTKSLVQANALANSDTLSPAPTNYNRTEVSTRPN